jgi:hypothetical protein
MELVDFQSHCELHRHLGIQACSGSRIFGSICLLYIPIVVCKACCGSIANATQPPYRWVKFPPNKATCDGDAQQTTQVVVLIVLNICPISFRQRLGTDRTRHSPASTADRLLHIFLPKMSQSIVIHRKTKGTKLNLIPRLRRLKYRGVVVFWISHLIQGHQVSVAEAVEWPGVMEIVPCHDQLHPQYSENKRSELAAPDNKNRSLIRFNACG